MTVADLARTGRQPDSIDELTSWVLESRFGPAPGTVTIASAFLTVHGTRHAGRTHRYRNEILSLRIGSAVGSCGLEADQHDDHAWVVDECVGATVAELLTHRVSAVRIAALDSYLMHVHPHPVAGGVRGAQVIIDGPSSLAKSQSRARSVIDLLPVQRIRTVLVIGVVNSLLAQLRDSGLSYLPCDKAGGCTEWGEPVRTSVADIDADYDAMLVTGMTLQNGSFDVLLEHARRRGIPMVMFAQSGSAVLPWFLGAPGVTAVSAEPYPFFSLDGGPSTHFTYRNSEATCQR